MKKVPVLLLLMPALLLGGCAEPMLVVAQPGEATSYEAVSIYYPDRPRCNFETIAHIKVTGGYFSLGAVFSKMRQQAAEVGASGLYVLQTRQLDNKEFLGTAKAIRCLPV
jgi:hypothetical protein